MVHLIPFSSTVEEAYSVYFHTDCPTPISAPNSSASEKQQKVRLELSGGASIIRKDLWSGTFGQKNQQSRAVIANPVLDATGSHKITRIHFEYQYMCSGRGAAGANFSFVTWQAHKEVKILYKSPELSSRPDDGYSPTVSVDVSNLEIVPLEPLAFEFVFSTGKHVQLQIRLPLNITLEWDDGASKSVLFVSGDSRHSGLHLDNDDHNGGAGYHYANGDHFARRDDL